MSQAQATAKQVKKELKRLGNIVQRAANDLIEVEYESMHDKWENTAVEPVVADIEALRAVLIRFAEGVELAR